MSQHHRRSSFLGLSWFQVIAGALAAMTSAWIASALGVAGTIIGAAVGSLVVTITSALYANTLDRGRTLIVQTDSGTFVETTAEPDEVTDAVGDEPRRRIHWKTVTVTTVVVLLLSGLAMGGYELVTGNSYGAHTNNPRIGNPFGGSSSSDKPDDKPTDDPSTTNTSPTSPTPSASRPTTTPSTTPTPSESTSSPAPEPSDEVE